MANVASRPLPRASMAHMPAPPCGSAVHTALGAPRALLTPRSHSVRAPALHAEARSVPAAKPSTKATEATHDLDACQLLRTPPSVPSMLVPKTVASPPCPAAARSVPRPSNARQ